MIGRAALVPGLVALLAGGLAVLGGPPAVGDPTDRPEPMPAATAPAPVVGPVEAVSLRRADARLRDGSGLLSKAVVGWDGRVAAVWQRGGSGRVFASVRRGHGTWSTPHRLSDTRWAAFDVAAGAGSAVSVVWTERVSDTWYVHESHRRHGRWSRPVVLGRGVGPRVVLDGHGRTTVLWRRGAVPIVSTRRPAGRWSEPQALPARIRVTYGLAVNRAGDTVALWDGAGSAFRARGSATWRTTTLSDAVRAYQQSGLGVAPDGQVVAAWTDAGSQEHPRGDVWWTRRATDGRWSPARKVAGDVGVIGEYGELDLTVNDRGVALAQWIADIGGTYVARFRPGHGFGPAVHLSNARWPTSYTTEAPLLTATGTALVAGQLGRRIVHRWHLATQPWSEVRRVGPAQALDTIGTRGDRMVVLFQHHGLEARLIDVPPAA